MKAPKCKLCGKEHYGLCKIAAPEAEKVTADLKAFGVAFTKAGKHVPAHEVFIQPEKPVFDRVKYQREYMRKYRAKKKS